MGRRAIVLWVLLSACAVAHPARASDFWEEVRAPGTRAFQAEVTRGRAALEARRWRDALAAGERATELRPARCEGPWLMGRAHAEAGEVEAAVARFRAALAREGTCLQSTADGARAAEVAAMVGDAELAAELLAGVLATMAEGPHRRTLFALYGDVLLTLGPDRLASAMRAYREVLRHQPSTRAQLGLALALRRAGKAAEAAELARKAASDGRVDALVARLPVPGAERAARRAVALEALEDMAGARQAWRAATEGPVWRRHAEAQLQRLDARQGGHP